MVEKKVIENGNQRVFFWKNENGNLNIGIEVKGMLGASAVGIELTRATYEKLGRECGWV